MKIQRNILYSKQKNKITTLEKDLKEVETSDFPDKEFKVMVTKMLTEFGRRMDEHSEKLNKELKAIKKNQIELKNTILEI